MHWRGLILREIVVQALGLRLRSMLRLGAFAAVANHGAQCLRNASALAQLPRSYR